jgi:hypothetical protein
MKSSNDAAQIAPLSMSIIHRIALSVIEHIARTTLARIVLNDQLWPYFTSKTTLAEFWAKPAAERQAIWGPPIDPLHALVDFDERYLPAAQLGG